MLSNCSYLLSFGAAWPFNGNLHVHRTVIDLFDAALQNIPGAEIHHRGAIAPFPEFAFSPGENLVIVKQWIIKNPVCERLS